MKTEQELQKYIRNEVSNPMIGQLIMNMKDDGCPYETIMEMMQPIIDNTPNVERKMVEDEMRNARIKEGERILSTIKNLK
jgi:hypothetical protein